jgi:hypothetical protein
MGSSLRTAVVIFRGEMRVPFGRELPTAEVTLVFAMS